MSHRALGPQFDGPGPHNVPIRDVGRFISGDFEPRTMAGMSRLRASERDDLRYVGNDFRDLVQSVRDQGVHTPLAAMHHSELGKPMIVDGVHRYLAARRAGLTHIPVEYIDRPHP